MEIRKVQITGGSSFTITLPKEWITQMKINKNDTLGLTPQSDGTLLITPNPSEEKLKRVKEFHIDEIQDVNYLFRLLIGAYIMGYNYIKIVANSKISPQFRDCAINFTQTAIGPEIVEETLNTITIKDLVNPIEMPFNKSIKRINILVRTMHEDAIIALKNKDKNLAEDVISRDREINRRHWLIARQSNMVLQDIILARKMDVSLEEANHYFLISRHLERIGDHAVRIAKNIYYLIKKKIDIEIINQISDASNFSLDILTKSLEALERRNIKMANEGIEHISDLLVLCENISKYPIDSKDILLRLNYISESIRRTGEYARNIAEIVINTLIKDN